VYQRCASKAGEDPLACPLHARGRWAVGLGLGSQAPLEEQSRQPQRREPRQPAGELREGGELGGRRSGTEPHSPMFAATSRELAITWDNGSQERKPNFERV
jgi:hypothetical protein